MALQPWIRKLKARVSSRRDKHDLYFLNKRQFDFEIARERMRSERSESPFAILLIELRPDRATWRDFRFLARLLESRLRITDTTGVLSDRRVGVLLPHTTKAGAWKVASDVCDVYPVGHDRPNCEVFLYPDDATSPVDRQRDGDELPAALSNIFDDSTAVPPRKAVPVARISPTAAAANASSSGNAVL